MFTNKHIIAALIISPVLALIAYFAVDMAVSEKPERAKANSSYPLSAKSNCRYSGGRCSLANGDVKIELKLNSRQLTVTGSHAIDAIQLALADKANNEQRLISKLDDSGRWFAELPVTASEKKSLRVAASIAGSFYYSETGLAFLLEETGHESPFTKLGH